LMEVKKFTHIIGKCKWADATCTYIGNGHNDQL
jgi:hypothetical protein